MIVCIDLFLECEEIVVFIVVIWGLIENIMDDVEWVVDDGVNMFKVFICDDCFVLGVGVIEIEFVK